MKWDAKNGWFYSVSENPYKGEYVLYIYYKGELKLQKDYGYRCGNQTVETLIKKIKKGIK